MTKKRNKKKKNQRNLHPKQDQDYSEVMMIHRMKVALKNKNNDITCHRSIHENNIGIPKPPRKPVLAGSTASILSIPGPATSRISNKPTTIIPAIK